METWLNHSPAGRIYLSSLVRISLSLHLA
jgi:hypothetical protein